MLVIVIDQLAGSAFGETEDERNTEVSRILGNVQASILEGRSEGACMDINGNKVGEWVLN